MRIEPIFFKDKKGRTVELRAAEKKDAPALIEYLKITSGETPYLIREPDEINMSLEEEEEFIQENLDAERDMILIALIDGKHVGNCTLMSITPYRRLSHRCEIAIALYQEFCGCGIGKKMLETVLDTAAKIGYEQAELEVASGNKNAIALYEKVGFKICATHPDNLKYRDGTYTDVYWMMKRL